LVGLKLPDLDLSNNRKLEYLICTWGSLTYLDLSENKALIELACHLNALTALDLSKCTKLTYLSCGDNPLTSLDISNNIELTTLSLVDAPLLKEVCVWEGFDEATININKGESPNICFQTDCNGDCSVEINLTVSTDTLYQSENISVTSSINGLIYLVLENTDKDIEVIRGTCIDSVVAVMNTPVNIPLEGIGNGTYWLYATDNSGNLSEPVAFTVIGVGIDNKSAERFRIYPNPTYTLLTIEMSMIDRFDVNIASLNGQLLLSKEMVGTTQQIDLSSFQKGVYFITIRSEDFVTTRKIVKQ
jgi:hypothetical protein